ncbi:fibrillarin-like rRNA/tRNA 2'-O-methyltransferase [Candidatus Parvarchaeota archaeon]|jgi:fibrillarin-like pre-rRNA processing protein|nr:fibrillarin-like rRNA/tRNA 2'-O-methyltransferase [Candidatus Parvarchaeota archaeon]
MELKRIIDRVYWLLDRRRTLVTLSAYGGKSVYGEKIFNFNDKIYREWIPYRSKFAAAFYKGLNGIDMKDSYKVLYLGASSGTTVSHVSDIIGFNGQVYAVEIAEEMAVNLILLAEWRKNIFPIVGDARKPENYSGSVPKCDLLYQDVAQRDQTDIFIKNADLFLKGGKIGVFAVKTRSIDVSLDPREVIRNEVKKLRSKFDIIREINLYPYQKDHSLLILRKKE